jgi:hypothetical protein
LFDFVLYPFQFPFHGVDFPSLEHHRMLDPGGLVQRRAGLVPHLSGSEQQHVHYVLQGDRLVGAWHVLLVEAQQTLLLGVARLGRVPQLQVPVRPHALLGHVRGLAHDAGLALQVGQTTLTRKRHYGTNVKWYTGDIINARNPEESGGGARAVHGLRSQTGSG